MLMYNKNATIIIEYPKYINTHGKLAVKISNILCKFRNNYHNWNSNPSWSDLYSKLSLAKFTITKAGKFKARTYSSNLCFQEQERHNNGYYYHYNTHQKSNIENMFSRKLVWSK